MDIKEQGLFLIEVLKIIRKGDINEVKGITEQVNSLISNKEIDIRFPAFILNSIKFYDSFDNVLYVMENLNGLSDIQRDGFYWEARLNQLNSNNDLLDKMINDMVDSIVNKKTEFSLYIIGEVIRVISKNKRFDLMDTMESIVSTM